jgi:hypothetical protein
MTDLAFIQKVLSGLIYLKIQPFSLKELFSSAKPGLHRAFR